MRRKSSRKLIVFGSIGGFAVLFLCLAFVAGIFWFVRSQFDEVQPAVHKFMVAMADRDAKTAYSLISTRIKKQTEPAELEAMLEGDNYVLFKGYRSLSINSLSTYSTNDSTIPGAPSVRVSDIYGNISYDGGYNGTFIAGAELEDDEWRIIGIKVTVPPEKYGK